MPKMSNLKEKNWVDSALVKIMNSKVLYESRLINIYTGFLDWDSHGTKDLVS